jgi:peptidoglycan hydrolase-like protein with peptidoglycan-binding domain
MNKYKNVGIILGIVGLSLAFAASASAATLVLSPSAQAVNVGDTFTVQVLLDTQGQPIDGVDLQALNYNPYNLQVQDADLSTVGAQIQPGTLMPNTVANTVDTTNGKIVFSQITNGGSTYTGSGVLATVTFKALVAGTANVTFGFTPGVTTDSNVASKGNDILSSVINGVFTINNAGTSNPGTGSSGGTTSSGTGGTTSSSGTGGIYTSTGGGSSSSLSDLLALLAQLKAQLKALVLQAIARGIPLPPGLAESLGINVSGQGQVTSYQFTRNLMLGMSGDDVMALQRFLNGHGFVIVATGSGSPGNEIIVFGPKTQAALAKYQASVGLPATGYFGPMTRAKLTSAN